MATRVKNVITSSSKVRIHYHSAIGTHRLKARPLKNILYPYYRNYKPVYRARNPRTPTYYWPEIDKYPWQSHQKRYVKLEDINMGLFSEFVMRKRSLITLYEVLHPLPLHGVNCLCWKPVKYQSESNSKKEEDSKGVESKRIMSINGFDYIVDADSRNNQYFLIKKVDYTIRPFRGKVKADLYVGDKLIKRDINPMGSIRGIWKYSYPLKLGDCKVTLDQNTLADLSSKVSNINIYRPNVEQTFKELVQ